MTYRILMSEDALAQLKSLSKPVVKKILSRIEKLAEEPIPHNAKKLKGYDTYYRIRFSEWRVIYMIVDDKLTIEVIRVGNRRTVYEAIPV